MIIKDKSDHSITIANEEGETFTLWFSADGLTIAKQSRDARINQIINLQ